MQVTGTFASLTSQKATVIYSEVGMILIFTSHLAVGLKKKKLHLVYWYSLESNISTLQHYEKLSTDQDTVQTGQQ